MATLEEQVTAEQEAHDAEEPDGDEDGLFDKEKYLKEGLQIPKVDGQTIDRIAVKFSGELMLDRSNEADVALYNCLTLGKNVELRVAGKVSATAARGATNRDGDLDVVVGQKSIKVDSVWVLEPEQLA